MLNREQEVYQAARRFNRLRRSCAPLFQGKTISRWHSDGNDGIFAFSRIDGGQEMIAVVNNTSAALPIPDLGLAVAQSRVYRNALNDKQNALAEGTTLHFNGLKLEGNSVAVFAPDSALEPFDSSLGVSLCR
jgi:hypothetical protein